MRFAAGISNLHENSNILSADDHRRMSNRQWRTDYIFKEAAGMYSFPHARIISSEDGETKFVDLRPRGVAAAGGISVCPET